MKQNLVFILVVLALLMSVVEERRHNFRQSIRDVRETFWRTYEEAVYRILDELEARNIYRQKDYGTKPP